MSEQERKNPYVNGKIYRIVCDDLTYYGSTIQPIKKRFCQHKNKFVAWCKCNKPAATSFHDKLTSFQLFERGTPSIFLVEDFPCERKDQLEARERFYIENNECVNKIIPGRTHNEWIKDNKERHKQHYTKYNEKNRERKRAYDMDYAKLNPEKIKEKSKYYSSLHYVCPICKVELTKINQSKHEKSKKHTTNAQDTSLSPLH
jgi:hypothetical protein